VPLIAVLWATRPDEMRLRELLWLLPGVLRLLRRLAADGTLPRGVRVRLWLLLAYLALPIDLIADFIPVLGYADDAVVALVLRSVVRGGRDGRADPALAGHPGRPGRGAPPRPAACLRNDTAPASPEGETAAARTKTPRIRARPTAISKTAARRPRLTPRPRAAAGRHARREPRPLDRAA
jgi:uncharacterized membrane protein YkvA (DUF1232 family)